MGGSLYLFLVKQVNMCLHILRKFGNYQRLATLSQELLYLALRHNMAFKWSRKHVESFTPLKLVASIYGLRFSIPTTFLFCRPLSLTSWDLS